MKKKRSAEILVEKEYFAVEKNCKICGININAQNGHAINISHNKKRFVWRNVCNPCANKKRYSVNKISFSKDYARLLRKIVGVEDYENDKGKPCIEGHDWTKLRWC